MSRIGRLRRLLFGISPDETTLAKRGFRASSQAVRDRLEGIGSTFVSGYHAALEEDRAHELAARLDSTIEPEMRGFAFEGAAMGLTLLDLLTPWRRTRLTDFFNGPASHHIYMVHVGAGWALARLRRRPWPFLERLDPLICWLAMDGYGFHEGYFNWRRSIDARMVPSALRGYARRAFDQGLGRSLWFVEGADVERIKSRIDSFDTERRADIWSGIGLAACYACGVGEETLKGLREAAGDWRPHLAQGTAFAAKARQRAGNPNTQTELACRVICGLPVETAARYSDETQNGLRISSGDTEEPSFEVWRRNLQSRFVETRV